MNPNFREGNQKEEKRRKTSASFQQQAFTSLTFPDRKCIRDNIAVEKGKASFPKFKKKMVPVLLTAFPSRNLTRLLYLVLNIVRNVECSEWSSERNPARVKQPHLFTFWLWCFCRNKKRHSLINVKVHIALPCMHAAKPVLPGHLASAEKLRLLRGNDHLSPLILMLRKDWELPEIVGGLQWVSPLPSPERDRSSTVLERWATITMMAREIKSPS